MTDWLEYTVAFVVFLASHRIPAIPPVRRRLTGLFGERGYLALYMALSVGLLGWLISATGRAPQITLWEFAPWQIWVPSVAMPAACLLAAFGAGAPNPLSILGREDGFDPERPGVAGVTRHPILWAFALWAGGHLVPNGDLAHVVLFGIFLVFALAGGLALDRRKRTVLGDANWARLALRTSFVPFAALMSGRWRPSGLRLSPVRLGAGILLYLAFLTLHTWVIGVSPFPHH